MIVLVVIVELLFSFSKLDSSVISTILIEEIQNYGCKTLESKWLRYDWVSSVLYRTH